MKKVPVSIVLGLCLLFAFAAGMSPVMAAVTVKSSPANGDCVPGNSVTFEWVPDEGYSNILLVKTNSIMSVAGAVYYSGTAGEGIGVGSKTVTGFANDGTTYYWWVYNSANWFEAYTAGPWSFSNGGTIEIPTRTSPAGGAFVCDAPSVTFQWEAARCGRNYWLLVKTDSIMSVNSPNTIYYDLAGEGDVTSKTVEGLPIDGTTIYWWVWSGDGLGNFCNLVDVMNNGPGSFTSYGVPEIPVLSSPVEGATVEGESVTFSWEAAEGANNYWLLVKTDGIMSVNSPNTIYYDIAGEGDVTSKTVAGLPADGTTIYWWVWSGRTGTDCDNFCNLIDVMNNGPSTFTSVSEPSGPCPGPGSAEASVQRSSGPLGASALWRHLAYFLLPVGAVIFLSICRRKRKN